MNLNAPGLIPALCLLVAMHTTAVAGDHHTVRFLRDSGTAQSLRALTFSPDGSELAVSTSVDQVSFIRTSDGEITGHFDMTPFSMAYSSDGSRIYMISERRRELIDVAKGSAIKFQTQQQPGFVGISLAKRNGKLLISKIETGGPVDRQGKINVGDELVGIGQSKAGRMTDLLGSSVATAIRGIKGPAGTHVRFKIIPKGQLRPTAYTITRQPKIQIDGELSFAPFQGENVQDRVVWCVQEGRHTFSDAGTGRTVASIETEDIKNVGQIAISPDSSKFAVLSYLRSGGGSAIEVFDIATQQREQFIPFTKETWLAIVFSGDSSRLLVGTWYTVEVLDWKSGTYLDPITLGEPPSRKVEKVASADGAAAGGAAIGAAARTQGPGFAPAQHVEWLASSSRGMLAVGNRGKVDIWRMHEPQKVSTIDTFTKESIEELHFSSDGKWLAFYCDGVLHIVDAKDFE